MYTYNSYNFVTYINISLVKNWSSGENFDPVSHIHGSSGWKLAYVGTAASTAFRVAILLFLLKETSFPHPL